jgi:cytochrome c553
MNKTLTTILGLAVVCATASVQAEEIKGNAQAGAGKNAMCIGCHGIVGYQTNFPEVYKVPMISGQGAGYISAALHAYKKGERRHPSMRAIAGSLSDQDIADLAAYYSAQVKPGDLPAKPARQPDAQVAALLQKGVCVSCHGDNFAKPLSPTYPEIAGQHPDYLFAALKAYKMGETTYVGRGNAIMGGVAKQFSNAELKALAGYISSLDSPLQIVPESRFR